VQRNRLKYSQPTINHQVATPKRKGESGGEDDSRRRWIARAGKCGEANEGVSVEASLLAVNQDESRANGRADLENSRVAGKPIKQQATYLPTQKAPNDHAN
jgi:hypothetical protein